MQYNNMALDDEVSLVRSSVVAYLSANVDTRATIIAFHGRTFNLTREVFESIMDNGDGDEIVPHDDKEVNPFKDVISGSKVRILVVDLINQIKMSKDADEIFVIRVILLILCTILVLTTGEFVIVEYINKLSDVKNVRKKMP